MHAFVDDIMNMMSKFNQILHRFVDMLLVSQCNKMIILIVMMSRATLSGKLVVGE